MNFLNPFWAEIRLCNELSETPSEVPSEQTEIEEGVERILKKPAMQDWMKSLEAKMAEAPPEKITDKDVENMSLSRIEEVDDSILEGLKEMLEVQTKYAKVTNPKTGQIVEFPYHDSAEFAQMMEAFKV